MEIRTGLRKLLVNRSTRFTELSVRELYMVQYQEYGKRSMAATGFLQPPPPMEPRTSSPAITWKKWRQRFEIYMTAAGKMKTQRKGVRATLEVTILKF